MIEIEYRANIAQVVIAQKDSDQLEEFIEQNIAEGIADKMREHIDEMSFIDILPNENGDGVDIVAELVLCSKAQIITAAEMQAQKMANYGLTEDQILDILETQLQNTKGF